MGSAPKPLHLVLFLTAISATAFFFLFYAQLMDDACRDLKDAESRTSTGTGAAGTIAGTSPDTELSFVFDDGSERQVEVVSGEDNVGGGVRSLVLDKVRILLGLKSHRARRRAGGAAHRGYGFAPAPAPMEEGAVAPAPVRLLRRPPRSYSHSPLPRPSRIPPVEDVDVRRGGTSKARARRIVAAVVASAGATLAILALTLVLVRHRSRRGKDGLDGKMPASGFGDGTLGGPKGSKRGDATDKASFDPAMELFYLDTFAPVLPDQLQQSSHTKGWSPSSGSPSSSPLNTSELPKIESDSERFSAAEILPVEGSRSSDEEDESFHSISVCSSHLSTVQSDGPLEMSTPTHPSETWSGVGPSPEPPMPGQCPGAPPQLTPAKSPFLRRKTQGFAPTLPLKPEASPSPRPGLEPTQISLNPEVSTPLAASSSSDVHGSSRQPFSPSSCYSLGSSLPVGSPSPTRIIGAPDSQVPSPAPCIRSNSSEITPIKEATPSSSSNRGSSLNCDATRCREKPKLCLPLLDEPPSPPSHGQPNHSVPMPPVSNVNVPQPPPPPPPLRFLPPPPPPPPPPSLKRVGSPGQAPPPPPCLPQLTTPVGKDGTPLPKLKPLHWDKVRAVPDRSMVWDKIRSSSFELDEEMIESLFGYNLHGSGRTEEARSKASSPSKHVLEPKRLQNFTILFKALNATSDQICEALLRGSGLSAQQLEALVKMVPTKEEEDKLLFFEGDISELDPAERFVRDILSIPLSFSRIEVMLYRETFEDEVAHLRKSFQMLEEACNELRSSRVFLRLLEAVLKTGNRMNVGTTRGGARAFKLDALLKLADVKGTDGKTTLLHFVVQEIARSEGAAASTAAEKPDAAEEKEEDHRVMGLELVSGLSTELRHVKTTAGVDLDVLASSVSHLSTGLDKLQHLLQHDLRTDVLQGGFAQCMRSFWNQAARTIRELKQDEGRVFRLVREITEYYHGEVGKDEANPLGIFVIVRDFLGMLDRVCKEVRSSKGHYSPSRAVPFGRS